MRWFAEEIAISSDSTPFGALVTTSFASAFALDPSAQNLLFREARTANTFTDEPVTDAHIEALYHLVKWGPTTMNSQPLRMVLVRSDEARARLISHMFPGNQPKVAAAPLVAIMAADTQFHQHLSRTFPHVPGVDALYHDDSFRVHVAKAQAWLQVGYVIMGVRALGLAAGPMNGFNPAGVDADLLAGTSLQSITIMNIGRMGPDAFKERLPRLDYHEVVATL
jgi:nitroreductase